MIVNKVKAGSYIIFINKNKHITICTMEFYTHLKFYKDFYVFRILGKIEIEKDSAIFLIGIIIDLILDIAGIVY